MSKAPMWQGSLLVTRAIQLVLITSVCSVALSSCSDSDETPSETVTVTESTPAEAANGPDTSSAEGIAKKPKPLTRAEQSEAVVKRYYQAVDSSQYRAAWAVLAPALQSELGGYGSWKQGYSNTVSTKVLQLEVTDVSASSATVSLGLRATDLDACGDTVDQTFSGTWTLTAAGRSFLGTAFDVAKTGGGTPVTDAGSCGGGGVPVAPAGCDPNYTGCVPPYPPDVDCIDVRQEVEVIGEDVHHLDIGGDDEACELYLK